MPRQLTCERSLSKAVNNGFRRHYYGFHGNYRRAQPVASEGLGLDLEIHLGYWLRLISNQVSATFARNLQAKDVSVAEWVALSLIAQFPNLASATLADEMGMTPGGVSKVLDKLTAKESIDRTTSPADSRVQMLSLTRTGRRMLPTLRKLADDNDEHFFAALDGGERVQVARPDAVSALTPSFPTWHQNTFLTLQRPLYTPAI